MRKTKVVFAAAVLLCSVLSTNLAAARSPLILERRIFGQSVDGRALEAIRMGDPKGVTVVVIGVIHGDEDAGLLITDQLVTMNVTPKARPRRKSTDFAESCEAAMPHKRSAEPATPAAITEV